MSAHFGCISVVKNIFWSEFWKSVQKGGSSKSQISSFFISTQRTQRVGESAQVVPRLSPFYTRDVKNHEIVLIAM